ncbi:MAG: NTP transferase domain-containing protein [Planctomycetaceae bacterium]|nr:NTP transferase domain-containing protein [Planctomycetaceae bacterium]
MLKTLGVIDGLLTTDSQRRNVSRMLGGKTVLEWVARQMTDSLQLNGVIVVTDNSDENLFVKTTTPLDVPVFTANTTETLMALCQSLEAFPAEHCVYLGLDWPLIDSPLIDQLVIAAESNPQGEYAAFQFTDDSYSAKGRPVGMFAEWYNVKALHHANRKAVSPIHREYPGMYFLEQATKEALTLVSVPKQFAGTEFRMTLESEEDWETIATIFESIDAGNIHWSHVAALLTHLPHAQVKRPHLQHEPSFS